VHRRDVVQDKLKVVLIHSRGPPPGRGQSPGHWLPRGSSWPKPGHCELWKRLFYVRSTSNLRRLDDQVITYSMWLPPKIIFADKETITGYFEGKKVLIVFALWFQRIVSILESIVRIGTGSMKGKRLNAHWWNIVLTFGIYVRRALLQSRRMMSVRR